MNDEAPNELWVPFWLAVVLSLIAYSLRDDVGILAAIAFLL